MKLPGILLARVQAERQRGAEGESGILAEIIISRRVSHLDGAVLHGIEHLEARHDFAGGKNLNLEFIVGDFGDALGHIFRSAVKRIQRFRPACRQTPFQFRHRLGNSRRSNRGGRQAASRSLQKFATFHSVSPFVFADRPALRETISERRALLSPTINARS
jgi:hypothetical protein